MASRSRRAGWLLLIVAALCSAAEIPCPRIAERRSEIGCSARGVPGPVAEEPAGGLPLFIHTGAPRLFPGGQSESPPAAVCLDILYQRPPPFPSRA